MLFTANEGLCFRNRDENIYECYGQNKGLFIVYGATIWSSFLHDSGIKIDYFCDRKAEVIEKLNNIPVIDVNQLEELVKKSGRRATIVICVGLNKSTVNSIYKDLTKFKINADVFNYFENTNIFTDKHFIFENEKYALYEHSFNCGYTDSRMTERSVEIPLAMHYLEHANGNVVEVGAVTPYYFANNKIVEIIDPTDQHYSVNERKSLFECNLKGMNVLSISTVEHIGTHDYGMSEEKNVIDAIEKITYEAASCLITAPMGYNEILDQWIMNNKNNPMIKVMKRGIDNHWVEIDMSGYDNIIYTPLWACGLLIIKK